MNKVLLSMIVVLSAQQSFACVGEAQIIARVSGVQLVGSTSCQVSVDPNSIKFYKKNATCPLDLHAVFQNGIEVGVRKEDTCRYEIGDSLSGVLVQGAQGTIYLEQ